MSAIRIISVLVALVCATACRPPLPCDDCDAAEDEQQAAEEEPTPDLPCGGADLMSDNKNCGVCGNECKVWYEGSKWEAGGCQAGECGPRWHPCWNSTGNVSNCEEYCALGGLACVPNGCAGLTAMLIYEHYFWGCLFDVDRGPDGVMTGPCDQPILWESEDDEIIVSVMCCCEQ